MTTEFVYRFDVALAATDLPGYGRGFNAVLHVHAPREAAEAIRAWIATIDHQLVQHGLGELAGALLAAVPAVRAVEIQRGDGVSCTSRH